MKATAAKKKDAKAEGAAKGAGTSARKATKKPPAPSKTAAKTAAKARKAAAKPAGAAAPARAAEAPAKGAKYPGPVVRLLVPMPVYNEHKEGVKKDLKALGMTWQYLGPGQGRYFNERAFVFCRFGDELDMTLRGDPEVVEKLAAFWRAAGAKDHTEEAKEEAEREEVRAWKLEKPVPRPGEPEFFFKRRLAEWEARRPEGA